MVGPKAAYRETGKRVFCDEASKYYVPYSEVVGLVDGLAPELDATRYDLVIGVENGGAGVGQLVFDRIRGDNPALLKGSVQVRRYAELEGKEPELLYFPKELLAGKRILVCDDNVDDGITLKALDEELRKIGAEPEYLVLYEKDGSAFHPEHVGAHISKRIRTAGVDLYNWLVFPWEKEYADAPAFALPGNIAWLAKTGLKRLLKKV